jgi:hypothetical protein
MTTSTKEEISIMKSKQIVISILAVLFVFPLTGTFAQQAASSGSIEVITTFDYPGAGNGINSQGSICGRYVDASGIAHGFLARVRGTPPTTPAGMEMKSNVSPSLAAPLNSSAAAWGDAMPAR